MPNQQVIKAHLDKLPPICAATHPSTGEIIFIVAGQPGYFPATTVPDADVFNAALKVTPAQVQAMLAGSVFGWAVNAADPDHPCNQPKRSKQLKYHSTIGDYYRIYYVDEHQGLWCWQLCQKVWHNNSYHNIFDLMPCTPSGEPIGPRDYTQVTVDTMPPEDDDAARRFVQWFPRRMEYAYLWERD